MRVDMLWVQRAFVAAPAEVPGAPGAEQQAVVAAILRQSARGAELLLIRRAQNPRDPWSGHMALPGGRRDAGDVDLVHTAIRETSEEIQVDLARDAKLLGHLPITRAVARARDIDLAIFPIVFALEREVLPEPNPREVESVLWTPVDHLLSPESRSNFDYVSAGQRHRFPAFDVDGHRVWGLTYRVLQHLLSVLDPTRTPAP